MPEDAILQQFLFMQIISAAGITSLNYYGATKFDYTESFCTVSLIQFPATVRSVEQRDQQDTLPMETLGVTNAKACLSAVHESNIGATGSVVRDSGYSILFSAVTKIVSELRRQPLNRS
jgi:hypothetical protein